MKSFLRRLLPRSPQTLEGVPSQCPRCDAVICLEPTTSLGEVACRHLTLVAVQLVDGLQVVLLRPAESCTPIEIDHEACLFCGVGLPTIICRLA